MDFQLDNIKKVYGEDVLHSLQDNLEDVVDNLYYFSQLGFSDVSDFLERYPFAFLQEPVLFQKRINSLVMELGSDYVEQIENNLELLERIC